MYTGIERWGNRRGVIGEGIEGGMKGGRGSIRAGGQFGLTYPRDYRTTTCHGFYMTRGV
jgi:hypothetical protein